MRNRIIFDMALTVLLLFEMLYQLTGDEEAGSVFLGESAEILRNANWQDVEKDC